MDRLLVKQKSNRFRMLDVWQETTQRRLNSGEQRVWFNCWINARPYHGDKEIWIASVSQRRLAELLACDRRTVRRSLESLTSKGLLVREQGGSNHWRPSQYFVYPDIKPSRNQGVGNEA